MVLYLLVAALVVAVVLAVPARPAELTPACWVFMGAAAISTLAGAQIIRLPAGRCSPPCTPWWPAPPSCSGRSAPG
ncbi:MAG TPA: hypothetical protein VFV73_17405 [Streptosporangiaceae bacterium]|nr:hypothetical protein [Streptosporangiaceae bacterium]